MSVVTSLNEEQQRAIDERGKNILVSAPAGSGKTKILVSRILELLKDGAKIDELLVLTFTQAAAQEMKQRLVGMLEEEIEKNSGDLKNHLLHQKEWMAYSYITNFHGFCNALIDHYGYLVGVKPGYEILSDGTALLQEALQKTLDDCLKDESFCQFRTLYFLQRQDLEDTILNLYTVLQSLGDRQAFEKNMDEVIYAFLKNQQQLDLSQWPYYHRLQEVLQDVVIEVLGELEELKLYCIQNGIEPFYQRPDGQKGKALEKEVPYLALKHYYEELLNRLQPGVSLQGEGGLAIWARQKPAASYNIPWTSLGDDIAVAKSVFSSKKQALTKRFKEAYENLIDTNVSGTMLVYQESHQVLHLLLDITYQLENHFRQLKQANNQLDFNDLERYATMLLQPNFPVARYFNDQLKEIMVDEYQDTNSVQENIVQLIAKASERHVPCFMVGDMKQSIYSFRQADPEIFKQKYDSFPNDPQAMRVDLGFNYRSSKIVLDSINFIFNQIMDEHIGSLEYYRDPSAWLNYDFLRKEGAKDTSEYEAVKQKALMRMNQTTDDYTEILLVNEDSESFQELDRDEYEARMIAMRIEKLKESGLHGKPLKYSDMAILMRSTPAMITYKKIFDRFHIPTTIVLTKGFMEATEIRQMMMVYQAMANPYDDLAMMAVLRAPFDFSFFSDQTIAEAKEDEMSLYESILEKPVFGHFVEVFQSLRQELGILSFADWNERFFLQSGYLERVKRMRNGLQRYQNLLLLVEKIRAQKDIHWIKDWVDFFDIISTADAPATMPKDQDAVVFMTIHKSKGLEFPVVFVAMHDKRFNMMDSKQRLIFDRHLSLAIKPRQAIDIPTQLFDTKASFQKVTMEYDNPILTLLSKLKVKETISEEMRIYYVALTRAGKKLILTGTMGEKQLNTYLSGVLVQLRGNLKELDNPWLYYQRLRHATCYLDWLLPSVLRHPDVLHQIEHPLAEEILKYLPADFYKSLESTAQSHFVFHWFSHAEILGFKPQVKEVMVKETKSVFFDQAQYAHLDEIEKARTIAVTALEKDGEVKVPTTTLPSFAQTLSPTQKGTLVHEFMEYYPLDESISIETRINQLFEAGKYDAIERDCLLEYLPHLEAFSHSICFHLMQAANQCLKEQPFCMVYENQVLHGTLDALLIFDDRVVVIDYKTDRVSKRASDEELKSRHQIQLDLYRLALEKMYPQKQVEAYLYYLQTARSVKL